MGLFLKGITASWSPSVRGMVSQRRSWQGEAGSRLYSRHEKERIPLPTCTEVDTYNAGGERLCQGQGGREAPLGPASYSHQVASTKNGCLLKDFLI